MIDERVAQRLQSAINIYCKNPLARYIFMVKTGEAHLGPNLPKNPGVEEVWGNGQHKNIPKGQKWRKGVPFGWGLPPQVLANGGIIGTRKYIERDKKFGWRSGRMVRTGESAYYLRNRIRVKPGNAYLVQAYAKLYRIAETNLERMPRVTLKVKWWGKKGWISTDIYTDSQVLTIQGTWVLLEMVVIPPLNAQAAASFLTVNDVWGKTEVLFDNLSFQEITEKSNKEEYPNP